MSMKNILMKEHYGCLSAEDEADLAERRAALDELRQIDDFYGLES